ncbi:sulfatase family protein [Sedimentisphaera salicampi]|uniref:Arylsulfatase n=1 Tax=Sedimentisphaera salicampi TaxID=1941349 RepID=A0A1W6LNC1_9BACT|nr:arylsulfatase [Sedimentisphaera salicampi]ARN57300.1 Arylsulfatase [Sedimentisphaera salicampi]OXU14621.1 Arylsulfatase [Sedimentisphaera salicampi]
MKRRNFLKQAAAAAGSALAAPYLYGMADNIPESEAAEAMQSGEKPNIVFIMADDMGYGDPGCLNPDSKIPTPNMDRLAKEGMRFTDAHSPSAVCTPTRYGVLTGRYCWRTRLKKGVLWGYSRRLIKPERTTVASMLKDSGYHTACVGKWHLGLTDSEPADYSKPLRPGPNEAGFDYWFGIPASLDMKPYCFIENGLPTKPLTDKLKGESIPRFYRAGKASEGFDVDDVMPRITEKACSFIDNHKTQQGKKPFFLYFPLSAPHQPWVPLEKNEQRSRAGVYGDFVTLVDDAVGRVLRKIEENGYKKNTLIIVTSDNGSHIQHIGKYNNGVSDESKHNFGHDANYIYRGQKADVWDGGHRVPFIARWPGVVKQGSKCDKPICLVDLFASCAEIAGHRMKDNEGEDSFSFLPLLKGKKPSGKLRKAIVHHSVQGKFAIRNSRWKYIDCRGSGGWTKGGDDKPAQLYDMQKDPDETDNLYGKPEYEKIVKEMQNLLEKYKSQGFSRPM